MTSIRQGFLRMAMIMQSGPNNQQTQYKEEKQSKQSKTCGLQEQNKGQMQRHRSTKFKFRLGF